MKLDPIFIHSLFRSGSTYLFYVFRRSIAKYWCYQESIHEMITYVNEEPQRLNSKEFSSFEVLRHPYIGEGYFHELMMIWPAWKNMLPGDAVYDGYFSPPNIDIGIPYLQTLIQVARGRPVFQECRTSGRISTLKRTLGGFHIYLFRNPWDQWWSYKINRYFDVANLLIINAPNAPTPVRLAREALSIEDWTHSNVEYGFQYYWEKYLSSEESYLVFYLIWCLGLSEGMRYADLLLSIDRLTDSSSYRIEIQNQLKGVCIDEIDFSDCRVPQGRYLDQDLSFFRPLEERVHQWLINGGWTLDHLQQVQDLRFKFQPKLLDKSIEKNSPLYLTEQVSQARELARHYETTIAEYEISEKQIKLTLETIYVSRSWRVTFPLRWISQRLRRITKSVGIGGG